MENVIKLTDCPLEVCSFDYSALAERDTTAAEGFTQSSCF